MKLTDIFNMGKRTDAPAETVVPSPDTVPAGGGVPDAVDSPAAQDISKSQWAWSYAEPVANNWRITLPALGKASGYKASHVSRTGLARLLELKPIYSATSKRLHHVAHERISLLLRERDEHAIKVVLAGQPESLLPHQTMTHTQMRESLLGQKQSLKIGLRVVCAEAQSISAPVAQEFQRQAESFIAGLEEKEKETHVLYGIPFTQSSLCSGLRNEVASWCREVQAASDPTVMLDLLSLLK